MTTTRAFLMHTSLTVITRPRLYKPALQLARSCRARHSRGIKRFLPSGRYLRFRLYTQYGNETIDKGKLKKDIIDYLEWTRTYNAH